MSHQHGGQPGEVGFTREFWDDRYRSAGQLWSGQPNPQLVAHAADLAPGDERAALQRRLAAAVRPGGTLLVVGHHPDDLALNLGRTGPPGLLWLAEDLAAALDPGGWEIAVAGPVRRPATDQDGQPVTATDTVLRAARR